MRGWSRGERTTIHDHPVVRVLSTRWTSDRPTSPRDIVTLETPDWCNVVALTDDERLVMVKQHRFGIDGDSLEIPGGLIDPGEAPLDAARRELAEETGFVPSELVPLGVVHPNPALQPTRLHMFLARGCRPTAAGPALEDLEDCETLLLRRDELDRLLDAGAITHALVWTALFAWRRFEARGGIERVVDR